MPASRAAAIPAFQVIGGGEDEIRAFVVIVLRRKTGRRLGRRIEPVLLHPSILAERLRIAESALASAR